MSDRHSTLELAEHDGRSTLELVRYDETAKAPERDNDATAFELDVSCLAPEVVAGTAPQLLYRNSLPEVSAPTDKPTEQPVGRDIPKSTIWWIRIIVAFVIIAAVAIGVGIGIWHIRRSHHSTISPPLTRPSVSTTPTTHKPTNTSTAQYILNDTSLAAIIGANGDRRLYFQDSTGFIRYAVRTASNQWNTSPHFYISTNAKNHTPLAVTAFRSSEGLEYFQLFYVSQDHYLNCSIYNGIMDVNINNALAKYKTAPDTRSLSVIWNSQINDSRLDAGLTETSAVLFYEDSNASVRVLFQSARKCLKNESECWYLAKDVEISSANEDWSDNSIMLAENIGSPFTSAQANLTDVSTIAYLFATDSTNGSFGLSTIDDPMQSPKTHVVPAEELPGYVIDKHSDVAVIGDFSSMWYYIWVNDSRAASFGAEVVNLPGTKFPFARLARATTPDFSYTYLYHQMNGTRLVEEQYDFSLNDWGPPTFIDVSLS